MPHLLDPKHIATQATYLAALHELDALLAEDPDVAAHHRVWPELDRSHDGDDLIADFPVHPHTAEDRHHQSGHLLVLIDGDVPEDPDAIATRAARPRTRVRG